jgi:B12 binding domain/Protein of unknown function (DUF4080)/Radical SAM superfamily
MPSIVLATLNARYAHASLGLRYLRANLGELRGETAIREFVIRTPAAQIAESLLALQPRVIGFGVYIWNVQQTTRVIELLKAAAPQLVVVVGGPEVSHEVERQAICQLADHVVTGWGDVTFARLARQLLHGPRVLTRIHIGEQPPLAGIALPYAEYSDDDLRHRHVYVEASRGCPFKCEFCLSALDRTAWPFPLDPFLQQLETLWQRGARRFKFVDRTFNLRVEASAAILDFFLQRIQRSPDDPPFLHFELIPDHLPMALRGRLARFPAGTLQLEIGIQTFNVEVQALISRRQKNESAEANLRWLRAETHAHLHVDLIAGLPGEDLASLAAGFDRLVALRPHEIQLGMLKRLRGAPIARHAERHAMVFSAEAPYEVISTGLIDAPTMQRITRFARYWDLIANSGRFPRALPLLLGRTPFDRFMALADWLYARTQRTHALPNEELYAHLHVWLVRGGMAADDATQLLTLDYTDSGARGRLPFLAATRGRRGARPARGATLDRQRRHLRA